MLNNNNNNNNNNDLFKIENVNNFIIINKDNIKSIFVVKKK